MYANQRYQPPHSRGFSFGAALAINAAIIAGLIYSAPNIIGKTPPIFKIREYKDPPIPPVDKPRPQPKSDKREFTQPQPVAPDPFIRTNAENTIETTTTIPDEPPLPVDRVGPVVEPQPPVALPPLMGALQDPRYLKDFQPEYPSSELRAQRDGQVRVRVLIGIDGRVKAVEQLSATSTAFFEVTKRQALGKWRFKPANRGGVPEESWKVLNVRFELENAR